MERSPSRPDPPGLWLARAGDRASRPSPPDGRYDVVVVGAGLAGLAVAHRLQRDGARVAVLEAGTVAGRTSGRSTAKVTALHGLRYHQLERGKGRDAAARYAAANADGVRAWRTLVGELGLDAGWNETVASTCVTTDEARADVDAEVEAAQRAGLAVERRADTELPLPVTAAVALPDQAYVDPVRLARGLADHLAAADVPVVEHRAVTAIEEGKRGCTVSTADGDVLADSVVQCTHLPVVDPAFLAARSRPERSYVVAGTLRPDGPMTSAPAGVHLAADAGWSVRPVGPDAPGQVLVGGEGHPMADDVDSAAHLERLAAWASATLGLDVQHQWSAFDYQPVDGVPFIGRLAPGARRRYVATGFGKWGLTTSMVAAAILGDAIGGRTHYAAELFDASRLTANVGRDLVRTNAAVAQRYVADRVRAPERPGRVAAGSGAVVREGGRLVAVARAADGTEHRLDPRCSHLGCIVRYNAGESVWDCPCHGSRFALDGTVLDGPAVRPLGPAGPQRG